MMYEDNDGEIYTFTYLQYLKCTKQAANEKTRMNKSPLSENQVKIRPLDTLVVKGA